MDLLDGLDEDQGTVALYEAAPLLVAATAGAGKTRALVRRIAALIELGAEPDRILAVTFSTKAAREMTNRLEALGCTEARVGTFHSLALQIIRSELVEMARWRVDDTDRYRICVKDAVSFKNMDWKTADVTHLLSYFALCKASGIMPANKELAVQLAKKLFEKKRTASREPNLCAKAYETAELIRTERQLLTFDDMLLECWHVLKTDESARSRWAARWDHVLQDEAQDENLVQHEIAAALARDHRSYTVVGDLAQSIYGFRGANPAALMQFEGEWKARVVRMGRNYRCGAKIVAAANHVLKAMSEGTHLGVEMVAQRAEAGVVKVTEYLDFDDEGEGVTERILESHEDDRAWGDHVVLFRTNAQSRGVEEQLLSARVPYVMLGGTNFYDRREVKDLLAYLRIGAGNGSWDDVRRSINTPFRFLGKAFVDALENELEDEPSDQLIGSTREFALITPSLQKRQRTSAIEWCHLVDQIGVAIRTGAESATPSRDSAAEIAARPINLLESLVTDLRYNEWLTRDEGAESPENNRVSNVRELVRAAGRFATVPELLVYVDDTLARAAAAKRRASGSDVVTLCSIHRSKGLEWPVVFVIGCNDKILPHAYADDLDEERRLFYVAVTRAADVLELSYVSQAAVGTRVVELEPSRFLAEAQVLTTTTSELSGDSIDA